MLRLHALCVNLVAQLWWSIEADARLLPYCLFGLYSANFPIGNADLWIPGSMRLHNTVTIPAVTPTFSSPSRPTTSPEVPCDTSSSHVPLGSHVIHPRAPSSRPMPRDPVSCPRWVQLRESPPSTPNAPDEPESSADPRIDSTALTEDLSILQGLLSRLPMSLWSAVPDMTDGH